MLQMGDNTSISVIRFLCIFTYSNMFWHFWLLGIVKMKRKMTTYLVVNALCTGYSSAFLVVYKRVLVGFTIKYWYNTKHLGAIVCKVNLCHNFVKFAVLFFLWQYDGFLLTQCYVCISTQYTFSGGFLAAFLFSSVFWQFFYSWVILREF